MKKTLIDRTGHRYGRLLVIERAENYRGNARWVCLCDCGETKTVLAMGLADGDTTSCGCLHREMVGNLRRTHGASSQTRDPGKHRSYITWVGMKTRCFNKRDPSFRNYGARGITICERWRYSFDAFYEDMGPRPEGDWSIDRINNDGNYEPGNCRWATSAQQAHNSRQTKLSEAKVAEIRDGRKAGVGGPTLARRFSVRHPTIYRVEKLETWKP